MRQDETSRVAQCIYDADSDATMRHVSGNRQAQSDSFRWDTFCYISI